MIDIKPHTAQSKVISKKNNTSYQFFSIFITTIRYKYACLKRLVVLRQSLVEAGFLRKKVSILIKSSLRLLIWSKLPTKVSTCDILLVNNSPICPKKVCVRFCWNICSSGIAYGFTLFCVFVPFVFKLWLSGSILHLSSNLVPLTPSYHLQTCVTQKSSWIQYKYWIPSSGFNSNPKFLKKKEKKRTNKCYFMYIYV